MNIKLYQTETESFGQTLRIDAIFPPQKRTIHLAQLDPLGKTTQEETFFLEFPKLVFSLVLLASNETYFKFIALNNKNEEFHLAMPNIHNKIICLGSPVGAKIKIDKRISLRRNPNINTAKDMIIPLIDEFWNSKFTIGSGNSIATAIKEFNVSRTSIYLSFKNDDAYNWTLLTEESNEH